MSLRRMLMIVMSLLVFVITSDVIAQGELAATLEVLNEGVEVKRVNTEQWIAVKVEAIVGVGDEIRTNDKGRARIVFFADGTDTELQANTVYRIEQFEGNEEQFTISASVLSGQTLQRLNRLLDADSEYNVNTPGMELAARGTQFRIRVEDSGRAGMLVSEGNVAASVEDSDAQVPPGFGIRSAEGEELSDVVAATTFEQLDAALDGCTVDISTDDDVQLNVRLGASLDFPRVGNISADEIDRFFGVTTSGDWYRIPFRDGFGWILSSSATVDAGCAGLREFPDSYGPEDTSLYSSLGETITLEDVPSTETPEVTPEATEESTEESTEEPTEEAPAEGSSN